MATKGHARIGAPDIDSLTARETAKDKEIINQGGRIISKTYSVFYEVVYEH